MVHVAITARAYDAIVASLPFLGSVAYEPQLGAQGRYQMAGSELGGPASRHAQQSRDLQQGEIIRLAKAEGGRSQRAFPTSA
jgi:hypothetical protein